LAGLAAETRALAHELRELAWTTNPRCDNAGSLTAFIAEFTERFAQAAGLACELELPAAEDRPVPARARHELLVVLKESLANVAKYAAARSVKVGLTMNNGDLCLTIKDDGRGFDLARKPAGTGLPNLRDRLQQAGGKLTVESRPGAGTTVVAVLPVRQSVPSAKNPKP